ncbi:hypothetical protein IMSAG013_01532 [Clostridiales bacterium]|nr:hypothetical protein IMSAG013_01532 [Clostridiales bacterium]
MALAKNEITNPGVRYRTGSSSHAGKTLKL